MRLYSLNKIKELMRGVWRYQVVSKFGELKPESMMINLTYKCNSRCQMCNIWKIKPKQEIGFEEWKKIVKDPVFGEIRELTITGGEIFLEPDLVETIKLFIESTPKLKKIILNTNGFVTKKIIDDVKKIWIECQKRGVRLKISVSIDGQGKIHDEIRGVKGGFEKALKTVMELKKIKGAEVGIATLLMKNNIENFGEIKKWLESTGVEYGFQIVGFHKTFVNNLEQESKVGFGSEDKKTLLKVLGFLSKDYYWADLKNMYQNGKKRTTPCPFLKDSLVIDSLGDVYYCLSRKPIGNFIKEKRTIEEIYFDQKNVKIRQQLPLKECLNCNSGCDAMRVLMFDVKRLVRFKLTGRLWKQGPINR